MESGLLRWRIKTDLVSRILGSSILLALLAGPAQAQDLERYETVQNRARPELDALGLPLGAFALFPSVELEYRDVDNIFADDRIVRDDSIVLLKPQLRLRSRWSRHRLNVGADLDVARYSDFDSEDYEDLHIWGDGRIDLRDGRITLGIRHRDQHQDRSSPEDNRSIEPVEYTADFLEAAYRYEPGATFAEASVVFSVYDYDNGTLLNGAPDINDDRDRDDRALKLRVGRELSSAYAGFIEIRAGETEYDQQVDQGGFERSSDYYQLLAGTTIDLSGVIFGEVYLGYRDQEYDDPAFVSVDGLAFGADVTWNPSGLTTLNFSGSREIDSTTIVGASGIEDTRFGLTIDHELQRNLIISLAASTETEDFEGLDREDDIQQYAASVRYLMNRNLQLSAGFEHRKRDTSGIDFPRGREYKVNDLFIQIRGQL